jgi:redox-sensitive bicupin YhaK (pirin superfamily)
VFERVAVAFALSDAQSPTTSRRARALLAFVASATLIASTTTSVASAAASYSPSAKRADLPPAWVMSKHSSSAIRVIPASALAVSEPSPFMFGNPENDDQRDNKAWTNFNWLKSRFHFSFAEYGNRKNSNFGVLRVANDDLVQPERGFGEHGHSDMEIATYIVRGELTHQDSTGTLETLGRGAVQYMSAGKGVRHSERNNNPLQDLRFVQMWIVPRARGGPPKYGGHRTTFDDRKDAFYHLVSDVQKSPGSTPVKINQDANIYVSEISPGKSVLFPLNEGRQAYVIILEGHGVTVKANNAIVGTPTNSNDAEAGIAVVTANAYDALELFGGVEGTQITFAASAAEPAHVLLVEMQQDGRGGRSDI